MPAVARGHAEVVSAAIIILRRRNDTSWFKVAADAALAHPANILLRQFAAEAIIQPIVADQEILLGKPIDPSVFQRVGAAADQLHAIWQNHINAEEVTADSIVPLAHNCAIALRFCDRSETAARLLDRTIEKIGRDPELLRTRVLLHLHADEERQALALIGAEPHEPTLALMAAEIVAANDPAAAMDRLRRIDVGDLPCELRSAADELAAGLAISLNASPEFDAAVQRLERSQHSTTTVRLLQARALKAGLVASPGASAAEAGSMAAIEADVGVDDDDETGLALPPPPELKPFIEHLAEQDASLTFVERIQAAVHLEHHGACEVASNILHERVALDRDTVGLRTYLAASVGANLTARAESILGSIPAPLLALPHYLRAAATLYWNIGDASRAAPLVARLSDASPQRLDLLLWRIDALLRLDDLMCIRKLLAAPVETTVSGSVKQCARLVRALATFGQPERALAFAYRQLATNRDDPAAWLSFMSRIVGPRDQAADSLLSQTISGDYVIEIVDPDGALRRFVIESDDVVQKLERDAIPPTHPIAVAVQGLKPGDTFFWPRTNASASVKSVKHKYLDAFHSTLAQFNERFPTAKGFQQIKVTLEGEQSLAEIKAIAKARSDHIAAQASKYAHGQLTLAMLAHVTGADPVETMLGLSEVATPYRVAIGLAEERQQALASIAANETRGCIIDAATLHCIRRLDLGEIVAAVCGPIAITQSTADIFQIRLQNFDAFGGKRSGVMGYRDGRLVMQEVTEEQTDDARRRSAADLAWVRSNCRVVPAQPAADPPALYRRLSGLQGARFFDDIYAASGANQLLLVDDLFTRQLAAQFRVSSTWLQPVLMLARERTLISGSDYTRLITDLIEIGQSFIGIDPSVLIQALELDRQSGAGVPGRRFRLACHSLGGAAADPASHCQTVLGFMALAWNSSPIPFDTYAATGHVLEAVLRSRTQDYGVMLSGIYANVKGHHMLRRYMLEWARGHFLVWT